MMKVKSIRCLYLLGYIGTVLLLSACGGGDDGSSTSPSGSSSGGSTTATDPDDKTPPSAAIIFPSAKAYTDTPSVTVRGTAFDDEGIASLTVNGTAATSDDEYATWSVTVPLEMGSQLIEVDIEDASGDQFESVVQTEITYTGSIMYDPRKMVFDQENSRAIVWDERLQAFLSVDINSGIAQILSDKNTPGASRRMERVFGMVLDSENNSVIVSSYYTGSDGWLVTEIVSLDLSTGAHTFILEDVMRQHLALDRLRNRLLMVSDSSKIDVVDLSSGVRESITNPDNTDYYFISGVAYDPINDRVIVSDRYNPRLMSINLETGEHTVMSDATTPNSNNPFLYLHDVEMDSDNNRVLLINRGTLEVYAVNVATGERTPVFDLSALDTSTIDSVVRDIVWDEINDRLLMLDSGFKNVLLTDLNSDMPDFVMQKDFEEKFVRPTRVAFDSSNNKLYVNDSENKSVNVIELNTGIVTTLTDDNTPNSNDVLEFPFDIALDVENNRALVTDVSLDSLLSVDLDTGLQAVISGNSIPNSDNPFKEVLGLALDSENDRALVLNNNFSEGTFSGIYSVDLNTGNRTIVADGVGFLDPSKEIVMEDLDLDGGNGRAYLTSYSYDNLNAVWVVDLNTGVFTVLSDNEVPNGENPFYYATDIVLNLPGQQAFVSNWNDQLLSVDLETGERIVLSSVSVPNGANRLSQSNGIAHDSENNLLYVTDFAASAVFVVDLTDGQRVVLSH